MVQVLLDHTKISYMKSGTFVIGGLAFLAVGFGYYLSRRSKQTDCAQNVVGKEQVRGEAMLHHAIHRAKGAVIVSP
jgi:hypothetical protein